MVNGPALPATRLSLSNWPGSPTPSKLRGDTGAETVLNFLKSDDRRTLIGETEAVTCGRFDCGGILALWAVLNRDAAIAQAARLVAASRAAEFGVSDTMEATGLVLAIDAYLRPEESPLGPAVFELPTEQREAALYQALLGQVGGMIEDIRKFDLLWIGEYTDVLQSEALINSGAVTVDSVPDLDLVILDSPLELHSLARLTLSAGRSRLLRVRSENTYVLEYRYESWVQYQSYHPLPRIALAPLATRLNMFERRDGRWRTEPVSEPRPKLFFDGGSGRPSASSIDRETVVEEVLDFLRSHRGDRSHLWSPFQGGL